MNIQKNVSLKKYNTFAVEARAKRFVEIKNVERARKLAREGAFVNEKTLVLGGGSNILFTKDFNGLVAYVDIKGMQYVKRTDDYTLLEVGAGENWHNFVEICVKNGFRGLENMALIPGKVGAAPVGNIGAYGAEQKDFFHSLKAVDLQSGETVVFQKKDCRFAYRNSIFKGDLKDKYLIASVVYKLGRSGEPNLSYPELKREVEKFVVAEPTPEYIFNTICRIRRKKLPDTEKTGNAGSFFKNPYLEKSRFESLKEEFGDIPHFADGEKIKIPAAWLIEKLGWKGARKGGAGVSEKHSLILINSGGATGEEILELSREISDSVANKFGVELEPEVKII